MRRALRNHLLDRRLRCAATSLLDPSAVTQAIAMAYATVAQCGCQGPATPCQLSSRLTLVQPLVCTSVYT